MTMLTPTDEIRKLRRMVEITEEITKAGYGVNFLTHNGPLTGGLLIKWRAEYQDLRAELYPPEPKFKVGDWAAIKDGVLNPQRAGVIVGHDASSRLYHVNGGGWLDESHLTRVTVTDVEREGKS